MENSIDDTTRTILDNLWSSDKNIQNTAFFNVRPQWMRPYNFLIAFENLSWQGVQMPKSV